MFSFSVTQMLLGNVSHFAYEQVHVVQDTVFACLSAGSQVSTWSQMSAGSKEDIMITRAQQNEYQMSAGFK